MYKLRDYQERTISEAYHWLRNNHGNLCIVLPTGSGKSHIIAELCKRALQGWPGTRILMLTHVKELIEQNASKLLQHWPDAPLGIYSSGLGRKESGTGIIFGGIQSLLNKSDTIGYVDLVIIDEAHLVNHKDEGGYRNLLNDLKKINNNMRVIGLTATPYRLGHGLITDKPAIFDGMIEPVTIEELVSKGFLSPLRSKRTSEKLDVSNVRKKGGEYAEKDLQNCVDTFETTEKIVKEIVSLAKGKKTWVIFCCGVDHAYHVAQELKEHGVKAECITGDTDKEERSYLMESIKSGEITALTNANVLTTGVDIPGIDLLVMLRPTLSPGLYVQMAGRGMRIKDHTDHCVVLDFAGVVATHGPITQIIVPKKKGDGTGEAVTKVCNVCQEICHASVLVCPACGAPFPVKELPKLELHNDDIMLVEQKPIQVFGWRWRVHLSKKSGKELIAIQYYGNYQTPSVTEYLALNYDGYAGTHAYQTLLKIAKKSEVLIEKTSDLLDISSRMSKGVPPSEIVCRKEGNYQKVLHRVWK